MLNGDDRTTDKEYDWSALALGVLSVVLAAGFVAYLFSGARVSWGMGPRWSVSFGKALLMLLAVLAPCVCIAGLSIAALRASLRARTRIAAPMVAGLCALASLVFAIGLGGLFVWVFVAGATNPNRLQYPLHQAACKADLAAVRIQLKQGLSAAKEFSEGSPSEGGDALASYFQCFGDGQAFDKVLVDELIRAGADINGGQRRARSTPLEMVVLHARPAERIEAVKYLVDKGASPNASSINLRGGALGIAVRRGDVELVRTLIQLGAAVDSVKLVACTN